MVVNSLEHREEEHEELLSALDGGAAVVTANSRLARRLAADYSARMLAAGQLAWTTPSVLPVSAWLKETYAEAGQQSVEPLPRLLAEEQEEQVWAAVIRRDGDPLLRVAGAARRARMAWKMLHEWRLDLSDRRFADNENSDAFRRWATRFRAHCREHEQVSRAELPGLLAALIARREWRPSGHLSFVGFLHPGPALEALGLALHHGGCKVAWVALKGEESRARRVRAHDAQHEMVLAAHWARSLLEAEAGLRIGIVVPDLGVRRTALLRQLRTALEPAALRPASRTESRPWNVSLGRPLSHESLIQTALGLLALSQAPVDVAAVGALLASPYWALPRDAAERRAELGRRALLDRRLRRVGEARVHLRTLRLECNRIDGDGAPRPWANPQLAAVFDGLIGQWRDLPARADTATWVDLFTSWLGRAGWPQGRPLDSVEFQALEAWHSVLSRFTALSDFAGGLTLAEALALLRQLSAGTLFQPRTDDAPVQALGLYEAHGQRFDHLWVMGLHDAAWPPAPAPEPFLPLAMQRECGMPHADPDLQRDWAEKLTTHLAAAAAEVVFSHPGREDGEDLACSPLISGLEELDASEIPLPSGGSWAERIRHSVSPEPAPRASPPPLQRSQVGGGSRVFSHQAACPFRAFAEHRLGARPLDQLQLGLGPARSGTLLHRALEFFWREVQTQEALLARDESALRALIGRCVAEAIEVQQRKNPVTLSGRYAELEADRLRRRILAWLEIERRRSPFRVIEFEQPQEFAAGGVQVRLKPDRVDELEDGARVVIDYKTGQVSPAAWFGERPDDPQLPLYGVAASADGRVRSLAAVAFAQIRPEKLAFSGVVRDDAVLPDLPPARRGDLRDVAENWPQVLQDWSAVLDRLGSAFRQGQAAVDPKSGPVTCRRTYCELAALCRIHEHSPDNADDAADGDDGDG